MTTATSQVRPLTSHIGAEISGIDLAQEVSDADIRTVKQALDDYSVVVLRGQDLSPEQQIAFTRRLGEMRTSFYNRYGVPGHPELTVISNIKNEQGEAIGIADAGVLWHTDASYLKTPDMYTLLYGIQIPEKDGQALGNTLFASTWKAYEALDEATKKKIDGKLAVHSFEHHINKKAATGKLKRAPLTDKQKAELPDVEHPVVRRHPNNGRPCLFVTEGHTSHIVGMDRAESDALLEKLWAHVVKPQFQYVHSWRKGDLIIWDNSALQHFAVQDYGDMPRLMHRAGIYGPVPV